mgnify:CR=1 FL=1
MKRIIKVKCQRGPVGQDKRSRALVDEGKSNRNTSSHKHRPRIRREWLERVDEGESYINREVEKTEERQGDTDNISNSSQSD